MNSTDLITASAKAPAESKEEQLESHENGEKLRTTIVAFSYNSSIYTLKFVDEGMSEWNAEDMNRYGKIEMIVGDKNSSRPRYQKGHQ
jgi:hypothetical protein